jgi:hypothetical protein
MKIKGVEAKKGWIQWKRLNFHKEADKSLTPTIRDVHV